ncbi:hypothetical protein ACYDLZ_06650 [Staphylococcus succinus]
MKLTIDIRKTTKREKIEGAIAWSLFLITIIVLMKWAF